MWGEWEWGCHLGKLHWKPRRRSPDNKVHGANIGPTWVLSVPGGPHVGPMTIAIWETAEILEIVACWCIMTTFKADLILLTHCWFSWFGHSLYYWDKSILGVPALLWEFMKGIASISTSECWCILTTLISGYILTKVCWFVFTNFDTFLSLHRTKTLPE